MFDLYRRAPAPNRRVSKQNKKLRIITLLTDRKRSPEREETFN